MSRNSLILKYNAHIYCYYFWRTKYARDPDSSYIDDKGNPLPYLPSMIENKDDEAKTKLMLTYAPPDQIKFMFSAISQGEKYKYFACEI